VLEFRIEAPSFMRNQVRIVVGTMLEVGRARRSVEDFKELLTGRPRAEARSPRPGRPRLRTASILLPFATDRGPRRTAPRPGP
jgi:tRNA U38,U39,U40 pseudouridine synthase TruA